MTDAAIELHGVRFSYDGGATWALDGVDLTVRRGDYVALVGANGSGKSTLGRVIAGLAAPDDGTVRLLGLTVRDGDGVRTDAYRAARHGIGAVFQNPEDQIVSTVLDDDVAFGPENLGVDPEAIRRRVDDSVAAVGLHGLGARNPVNMSGGQQQRAAIAGMLAMHPSMLVLDEPTAMLDAGARAEVMRIVDGLHARGTTIVHITHHADEAAAADRVVRLSRGRIVSDADDGTPAGTTDGGADGTSRIAPAKTAAAPSAGPPADEASAESASPAGGRAEGAGDAPVMLEARHVSFAFPDGGPRVLDDVDLTVRRGEMVAVRGRNGAGKSTLARLLCGLGVPDAGEIRVAGMRLCGPSGPRGGVRPARRRDRARILPRIGYVMQHPERQLFADTVAQDVSYGPSNLGLDAGEVARRTRRALELLGISGLADRPPFALSGGQRRLAAIAGVLACEPDVLVMDEPTSGLDAEAADRIRRLMDGLRRGGAALVVITHDDAEAAMADRVVTLGSGGRHGNGRDGAESRGGNGGDPDGRAHASFVGRLDPRVKLLGTLAMMCTAFAIGDGPSLLVGAAATLAMVMASGVRPRRLWRAVRPFLALFAVMWVLNLAFTRSGSVVAALGPLSVTDDGLRTACLYFCRLVLVIVLGAVLLSTTTLVTLADAVNALLRPFARFGLHTDETALVISLAMRFVPTLGIETRAIIDAQSARGGGIAVGPPSRRMRAMAAIVMPVLAGALRHADNLALALDARCYEGGDGRTHLRRMRPTWRDAVFAALAAADIVAIIALAVG